MVFHTAQPQRIVAEAIAGVRRSQELDYMLRIEALLPGFGGVFIDASGDVVALVKGSPSTAAPAVRAAVSAAYQARPEPIVREIMARANSARVVESRFSLSELIALKEAVLWSGIPLKGLVGAGIALPENRVRLWFDDAANLERGLGALTAAGIPLDALLPEASGGIRLTAGWSDEHRPTRAGIKVTVANASRGLTWFDPNKGHHIELKGRGSLGYLVHGSNGSHYYMVASHMINMWAGANGAVGDTIFQPDRYTTVWGYGSWGGPIGVVALNPLWDQHGCIWPATGQQLDYCTESDVALVRPLPNVTGRKEVGRSTTIGWAGHLGSDQIAEWHPIWGVVKPEFVRDSMNILFKSGYATGTTGGYITAVGATVRTSIPWGPPGNQRSLMLNDVVVVRNAASRAGDSGGPVFYQYAGKTYAFGLNVANNSPPGSGGECVASPDCSIYVIRWDRIEERFGMSLDPSFLGHGGVSPGGIGGDGGGDGGTPPGGGGGNQCPIGEPGCAEQ